MAKNTRVEEIRSEMARTREQLKSSVADFRESIEPKKVIKRSVDDAKAFAKTEFQQAKAQFVAEDGSLRTKRVLAIAGAVAGVVAFAVTMSVISKKRQIKAPRGRKALESK